MLDMWKVYLQYFFKNLQTSQADISSFFYFSRIRIKNVEFPGYCFYMNTNIYGDFQICMGVPLTDSIKVVRAYLGLKIIFSFHFIQSTFWLFSWRSDYLTMWIKSYWYSI